MSAFQDMVQEMRSEKTLEDATQRKSFLVFLVEHVFVFSDFLKKYQGMNEDVVILDDNVSPVV